MDVSPALEGGEASWLLCGARGRGQLLRRVTVSCVPAAVGDFGSARFVAGPFAPSTLLVRVVSDTALAPRYTV